MEDSNPSFLPTCKGIEQMEHKGKRENYKNIYQ